MPSECKVPAAAFEADISNANAIEEVTIAVQQQMDNAQQIMNHPTDTQHQLLDEEEEQQNESNNDNNEQQSQRMTTSTMPAAQSNTNNEQSSTQQQAQPTTPQPQHPTPSRDQSQTQQPQQIQHHSPLTKVNGKGLWRSWKRNFQSKLLALMDLIDNSLDAAVVGSRKLGGIGNGNIGNNNRGGDNSSNNKNFIGRVHVYPDKLHQTTTNNQQNSTTTTGILLLNNSHRSIRPLQHILEVYNSSKTHSGSEHIGENGVGLKQGAATLSDLTFVLVKKKKRRNGGAVMDNVLEEEEEGVIELGLIAESLQREEGCCLPAFTFPISNDGGKQDITNLLSNPNKAEIAACVTQYGNGSLECGIDRLSKHFHEMCFGGTFGNDDNVFCLILDRVDYGHLPTTEDKCFELLKDLRMEIPRFYLHMSSTFDFRIGRGTVPFDYWQQRLVELSSITVLMNHSSYWHEYKPESDPGAYKLRVLIGFDRFRINNRESGKEGSLYIYSRESGRLIKCMPDGRGYLGLDNTGSMYCQGLTIIIDDIGGHLPLNPTKQAIAFAEQTNGAKHEENLITLVGILVKTYFGHHINKFKKSRTLLTQTIKEFGNDRVQIDNMKDIDSSELTTFEYKTTSRVHSGRKKILIDKKVALKVKAGRDTRFLLIPPRRPIPIPPLQVVDTRRDDQNRSRKRRADEMMITTGRERVAPPNAFIPNNVVVENNSLPAAGMNGYNNTVPQPTAHFEPLARPNMRANNVQRQLVLNQSSTQPTAASTGTSTRGKTLNHLNAMQRNTLQQQQLQQQQVTQQPIIQQPLLNNQLAGQSQQSSNTSDSPSIQDRYTALLILYRGQCQENVARKEELRTMNAEIQELQTENEQLEDVAVAKNEELQAKDAKIQELTTENDQLKDDVTALKQQLIEIVQNRAEVETSEMI
mmetsp:Transcript_32684/g.66729  ORF Transcript_32684/g.66729 Transcript_32684/m.66729 type:complete len:920 (-) Transcript_32684:648-3407(-)